MRGPIGCAISSACCVSLLPVLLPYICISFVVVVVVVVVNLMPLVTCDCCEYVFQLVLLMILRMTVVTGHDVCKLQAHVCVRVCACVCAYVCV